LSKKISFISAAVLSASCLLSNLAHADEETQTYFLCKNGAAVRTMRVEQKDQGCKAFYTKSGVDKVVGKSGTSDVCLQVVNRIKSNLETGSWKCRDISQTRVSSSAD
jgi:hypothetical protein